MTLSQRQLLGLLLVVIAAVIGVLVGKDNAMTAAVIAGAGGVAALLFSGAAGGPKLDGIRNAIRRAGMGKSVSAPEGAPDAVAALYEELGTLVETISDAKDRVKELESGTDEKTRDLQKQIERQNRALTERDAEIESLRKAPAANPEELEELSTWLS